MPLLRKKPFVPVKPPKHLKPDDEVFYCEMTSEIFTDYEVFYQRMILCNSLVWSCELTGKASLTYKEALDSENAVRKSVEEFPTPSKRAVLTLVHHTRRGKIQELTDDIFDFLRQRYQIGDHVEVRIKDKTWSDAVIVTVPDSSNVVLLKKKPASPIKTCNNDSENGEQLKSKESSLLDCKKSWPDTANIEYKVEILSGSKKGEKMSFKGKLIRRAKGIFTKDRLKIFMKQTCNRTTNQSDDGYWAVLNEEVVRYSLGETSVVPPQKEKGSPSKKKKKKTVKEMLMEAGRKQKSDKFSKDLKKGSKEKKGKSSSERPKMLTLEQKRKEYEKEKEEKRLELETLKLNKMKEKEEEKARKKNEREKEREKANELKKLELDFLKEYNKPREDLKLEDSKPLPTLVPFKSKLDQDLIGDAIMVVEFVNIFGSLFNLEKEIDEKVTLSWLEDALNEHDAEGKYYQVLKFLLHSYLCMQQDESKVDVDDDDDDQSTSGENTPVMQPQDNEERNIEKQQAAVKNASTNARAAAVWPMLYQGMALREITIEPYSLTEVLRLHILSSGVRIGGIMDYNDWLRRGQYQLSDDPCVSFRHKECNIMRKLMISSVYDLDIVDKLKLLVLLCNQALMLSTTREYMEDAYDKVKSLKKELRELQYEENKRRRKVQQEKWKRKMEERTKLKEEKEKMKKDKKEISPTNNKNKKGTEEESVTIDVNKDEKNLNDAELEMETTKLSEEQQEERKRRREAKEIQIEEFYREKFLFKEKELLREIGKYSAIISESPLGKDRTFRRYWNFSYVDGLLVENDDDGALYLTDMTENDMKVDLDDVATEDEDTVGNFEKNEIPQVSFEDIIQGRNSGNPIEKLILNRYKCNVSAETTKLLSNSHILKRTFDNIKVGLDPNIYAVRNNQKWYSVSSKEQYSALIEGLNSRGRRELNLKDNLSNDQKEMMEYYAAMEAAADKPLKKTRISQKKADPNEIDKSLFKTMNDYIEGNLRDQLLELEERLWIASVGGISEKRDEWRAKIELGITKLIQTLTAPTECVEVQPIVTQTSTECVEPIVMVNSDEKGNVDDTKLKASNEINGHIIHNGFNDVSSNDKSLEPMDVDDAKVLPVPLPLKNVKNEKVSRCSTPVDLPESELTSCVQELAEALLQVERCVEKRFLKLPLGETEEMKKERIKEMIEAANTDFELDKNKQQNCLDENKDDEEKKPSTTLSRWEESLLKCTSFSQIFVHLNTLDRSIMWDKSIQNTKCRLCRRKGNEDEMLLCDGCDRGFHMSCLKPPLKKVPEGDWFCNDCRPIEVKRRTRKHSSRNEEETEEEEEDDSEQTEDDDSDVDSDVLQGSDEEEEEEEYEQDWDSDVSEHGELCTICNTEGTLILCEGCPRSYHIECCYPPLKKVPRGIWKCQICTGIDSELPYRKRALTQEKNREKLKKGVENSTKKRSRQQRGQPTAGKQVKRNQKSPPTSRPSKKAKLDNDADSQSSSSQSSQRNMAGINRHQLKQCTSLINEICKKPEAEAFLEPVDSEEVPDYADFIDNPMDFATIKTNLNSGKYFNCKRFVDDIRLVFSNCETYNPPKSQVARDGNKLKVFVNKQIKELNLDS